jgi:hypothetical protein
MQKAEIFFNLERKNAKRLFFARFPFVHDGEPEEKAGNDHPERQQLSQCYTSGKKADLRIWFAEKLFNDPEQTVEKEKCGGDDTFFGRVPADEK